MDVSSREEWVRERLEQLLLTSTQEWQMALYESMVPEIRRPLSDRLIFTSSRPLRSAMSSTGNARQQDLEFNPRSYPMMIDEVHRWEESNSQLTLGITFRNIE